MKFSYENFYSKRFLKPEKEKKMKKIFVLGITVLILSLSFISCDNGTTGGGGGLQTPPGIRGTYIHSSGDNFVITTSNVTFSRSASSFTRPYKGIYTNTFHHFFEDSNVASFQMIIEIESPPSITSLHIVSNGTVIYSNPTGWTKQ